MHTCRNLNLAAPPTGPCSPGIKYLALKGQRRQVRRSRPRSRARQELGTYYLVRLGRDTEEVVERDVHLKTKARELGVP